MRDLSFLNLNPRVIHVDTLRVTMPPEPQCRTTMFYELELIAGNLSGKEYRPDGTVPLDIGTVFLRRPGTKVCRSGTYRYYIFVFDCVDDPFYREKYALGLHSLERSAESSGLYSPSTHFSPFVDSLPDYAKNLNMEKYLQHFENAFHCVTTRRKDTNQEKNMNLMIHRELTDLLCLLMQDTAQSPVLPEFALAETLYEVKFHMDTHYTEKLTLQELGTLASLSKEYLCRQFHSLFGKSPMQYLQFLRLDRAKAMLAESQKNVAEIAAECGFSSEQYFFLKFKETLGITPAQFREENTK